MSTFDRTSYDCLSIMEYHEQFIQSVIPVLFLIISDSIRFRLYVRGLFVVYTVRPTLHAHVFGAPGSLANVS